MFSIDKPITISVANDASISTGLEFLYQGTGSLSSTFVKAVGSVDSNYKGNERNSSQAQNWSDVQLTLLGVSQPSYYEPFLQFLNINPEIVRSLWSSTAGLNTFQIFMVNSRPQQRGVVKIVSSNPEDPPLIDPKYLQNARDVAVSVEGNSNCRCMQYLNLFTNFIFR
jgi:choline dehydrogenase-like flavoprotein